MTEGLTAEEVRAFAEVFGDPAMARHVLDGAEFPAGLLPLDAPSPLLFWASVSRLLWDGVMADGRARLLAAARELYPHNPVFAVGPVVRPVDGAPVVPLGWNLPGRLVRFVGRERLLDDVHKSLSESTRVALVALDGLGGVGKTTPRKFPSGNGVMCIIVRES